MKINKSVEQAVYVLIILALQKGHKPVKSHVLSSILQVSDSYLKKILMKLSRNKLVTANASKQGGYQLSRSIEKITLKDVFFALELNKDTIKFSNLSETVFDEREHVKESEQKIMDNLNTALEKFYEELEKLKLSELLRKEAYENGAINWEDRTGKAGK